MEIAAQLLAAGKLKASAQTLERHINEREEEDTIKYGIDTFETEAALRKGVETLGYLREVQAITEGYRMRTSVPSTVNREFREQAGWWAPKDQMPKNWFAPTSTSVAVKRPSSGRDPNRPLSPKHQSPCTPVAAPRNRPTSAALRAMHGVTDSDVSTALGAVAGTLAAHQSASVLSSAAKGGGGAAGLGLRASSRTSLSGMPGGGGGGAGGGMGEGGMRRAPRASAPGTPMVGSGGSLRNLMPGGGGGGCAGSAAAAFTAAAAAGAFRVGGNNLGARRRRSASSSGMELIPGVTALYDGGGDAAVPGYGPSGPVQLPPNQPRYSINLFQTQLQQQLMMQQMDGGGGSGGYDDDDGDGMFIAGDNVDSADEGPGGGGFGGGGFGGFGAGGRGGGGSSYGLGTGYRAMADEDVQSHLRNVLVVGGPSVGVSFTTATANAIAAANTSAAAVHSAAAKVMASNAEARGVSVGYALGLVGTGTGQAAAAAGLGTPPGMAASGAAPPEPLQSSSPSTSPRKGAREQQHLAAAAAPPPPSQPDLRASMPAAEALFARRGVVLGGRASVSGGDIFSRVSISGVPTAVSADGSFGGDAGDLAGGGGGSGGGGGGLVPTPPMAGLMDARGSPGVRLSGRTHRSVLQQHGPGAAAAAAAAALLGDATTSPRSSAPNSPVPARVSLMSARLAARADATDSAVGGGAGNVSPGGGNSPGGAVGLRGRLRNLTVPAGGSGAALDDDSAAGGRSNSFKRAMLAPASPSGGSGAATPTMCPDSPAGPGGCSAAPRSGLVNAGSDTAEVLMEAAAAAAVAAVAAPPLVSMLPSPPVPRTASSRFGVSRLGTSLAQPEEDGLRAASGGGDSSTSPQHPPHQQHHHAIRRISSSGLPASHTAATACSGSSHPSPPPPPPLQHPASPSLGSESSAGAISPLLHGAPSPFYSPQQQHRLHSAGRARGGAADGAASASASPSGASQPAPLATHSEHGDAHDHVGGGGGVGRGGAAAEHHRRSSASGRIGGSSVSGAPRSPRGGSASGGGDGPPSLSPRRNSAAGTGAGPPPPSPQQQTRAGRLRRGSVGPVTILEEPDPSSDAPHHPQPQPQQHPHRLYPANPPSPSPGHLSPRNAAAAAVATPTAHHLSSRPGSASGAAPASPIFNRRTMPPGSPGGAATSAATSADAMLSVLHSVKDSPARPSSAAAAASAAGRARRVSMSAAASMSASGSAPLSGDALPVGMRLTFDQVGGQAESRPWEAPSTSPPRRNRRNSVCATPAAAASTMTAAAAASHGNATSGAGLTPTPLSSRQAAAAATATAAPASNAGAGAGLPSAMRVRRASSAGEDAPASPALGVVTAAGASTAVHEEARLGVGAMPAIRRGAAQGVKQTLDI